MDADGRFSIDNNDRPDNLYFSMALHRDDSALLIAVQKRLNIGYLSTTGKKVTLTIKSKSDLVILMNILDEYPLNSTKHLNYLAFKKAYENNYMRKVDIMDKDNIDSLYLEIASDYGSPGLCKLSNNNTNGKKVEFNLSTRQNIKITPYWFLGFVEGDGSFNISTRGSNLIFSIGQSKREWILMQKIKEYLLFLRGNKVVRSKSNIVALYIAKPGRKSPNHKALEQVNLKITDNRYIKDVLVPFFKCLTFLSKKR